MIFFRLIIVNKKTNILYYKKCMKLQKIITSNNYQTILSTETNLFPLNSILNILGVLKEC